MSFKDWIPAGGKGHVLAEVTGNVGNAKGGRMRRFRRKSWGPRRQRVWTTTDVAFPQSVFSLAAGGSEARIQISPNTVLSNPTTANNAFDQKYKLVGTQGSIYVWAVPNNEDAFSAGFDGGAGSFPMVLFYLWKVQNQTVDTIVAPNATNNDVNPTTSGDFQKLLAADNVLNWGMVEVPVWRHAANWGGAMLPFNSSAVTVATTPGSALDYTYCGSNKGGMYFGRVPRPRIPRTGIILDRNKCLVLYTFYAIWSLVADDWALGGEVHPGKMWPMLRLRWQK